MSIGSGYIFGDKGSEWRMMKLRSLRGSAKSLNQPVEEIAFERYGTLERYDEAREEEQELERRKTYGIKKTQPTGDLYRERLAKEQKHDAKLSRHEDQVIEDIKEDEMASHGHTMTLSELNSIKAKLLKAQMMQSSDVQHLQQRYDAAVHHFETQQQAASVVVLPDMDSRGQAVQKREEDMTIEDMVREEKRESKLINAARQDADRIAKDGKYSDTLDYQDEQADKLAQRVQRKELNLKNMSISQYQKMQKVLDSCSLCHKEEGAEPPIAPVVSLATRTFLSLPSAPLTRYHCLIVPLQHRTNTLECDDDEWVEIRNFMKSLTRLYDNLGMSPMFYESNARPYKKSHAAIECLPIPKDLAGQVPRFWQEALVSADEEWSQHRPLIKTDGNMFTRKMTSELAYFHVWFDLNGGLGHVIEDDSKWPRGDLFGREVVGSILGLDVTVWRRHAQWDGNKSSKELQQFQSKWQRWDWTQTLLEQ
ncbi:CwfJ C-terminus 1-domain-containing protein-like protein [Protomyces lactucae-debilis]|uniref:CwfJ C-terminus 1-domain-containing protein-like protein n=1 Tax=Protomyces lactucae-debilis TaxID=2754530 RepID=A0A1Y2FGW4_PROLT|nr:CwfJ C-terminus 1-domain-containing protein-like protein [Protomyces lactucae-debilis]ORY83163.1 CwfJ C-terminus 1-domain-containing protein-like protein [Protomyces lactucae-debilis]